MSRFRRRVRPRLLRAQIAKLIADISVFKPGSLFDGVASEVSASVNNTEPKELDIILLAVLR
jgi:hypothetical protein